MWRRVNSPQSRCRTKLLSAVGFVQSLHSLNLVDHVAVSSHDAVSACNCLSHCCPPTVHHITSHDAVSSCNCLCHCCPPTLHHITLHDAVSIHNCLSHWCPPTLHYITSHDAVSSCNCHYITLHYMTLCPYIIAWVTAVHLQYIHITSHDAVSARNCLCHCCPPTLHHITLHDAVSACNCLSHCCPPTVHPHYITWRCVLM